MSFILHLKIRQESYFDVNKYLPYLKLFKDMAATCRVKEKRILQCRSYTLAQRGVRGGGKTVVEYTAGQSRELLFRRRHIGNFN